MDSGTSSASAASRSTPRTPRSSSRACASSSSTRPATRTSAARSSACSAWSDAVLLLVDAVEGVMPQTRFVLRQGARARAAPDPRREQGRPPRAARRGGRGRGVRPARRARRERRAARVPGGLRSAKQGAAVLDARRARARTCGPLLETILEHAPAPLVDVDGPLQFQACTLGWDDVRGPPRDRPRRARPAHAAAQTAVRIPEDGQRRVVPRHQALRHARPRARRARRGAEAGDIVILAGVDSIEIGDTVCDPSGPSRCRASTIDPPTLRVQLLGQQLALRGPRGPLRHEPADRRAPAPRGARQRLDQDRAGPSRGRLRGGRPRRAPDRRADRDDAARGLRVQRLAARDHHARGRRRRCEPVEDVVAEVPETAAGAVMEKLSPRRKGRMVSMENRAGSRRRSPSSCRAAACSATAASSSPTRAARASSTAPCAATSPSSGELPRRGVGAIVSSEAGRTTTYALFHIQERSTLFVGAGVARVRGPDRRREPPRRRHERQRRAREEAHQHPRRRQATRTPLLDAPRDLTIERALEWIDDDELLEVTPESVRLRKKILPASQRKR